MENRKIQTVEADGDELTPRSFVGGTRGSYGTVQVEFSLSEEWSGLSVKAVFYPRRGEPIEVPYLGSPINIPAEVMKYDGEAYYVLSGIPMGEGQSDYKRISLVGRIVIEHTLDDRGSNTLGMTQNTFDMLLAGAAEHIDKSLRNAMESGEFDGEDGKSAYELWLSQGNTGTLDDFFRAVCGDITVLPEITEEDEGRVLTASGGAAVWRDLPKYTGEYSVTPSAESTQTLETAQKYMGGNVTVEKIPYYEMDNPSGGTTIYIGSDGEIITE
ncbi:MAG: hypothetical protein ACI4XJ_06010 [Eubacteriales bacterium]